MDEEARAVEVEEASEECRAVIERIEEAVVVERSVLTAILAAIVARGHVLLEDVPGTGKTVTARVFAESLGLDFQRIQFTPDLLPSDVTGSNVYNEHDREFEFAEGPIFANVVLADEINRAPPKTQAALLEAMEERQVSVDGTTHELPTPFIVIATQNPVEQEGTFRLPEAQRDRFLIKTSIGYPDVEGEMGLLDKRANRETIAPSVEAAVDSGTVLGLQNLAENVTVEDRVRRYIVELSRYTRTDSRTEIGVSPRGVQRVFEATRAAAVIAGRDYVTPDDVKRIAVVAMAHRLVMTTEATVEGVRPVQVIHDALDAVDVPAVSPDAPEGSQGEGARSGPAEGPGSEPAQDDAGPSDDGTGSTGHQAGSETPTSAPRGQGTRSGGGGQSQSGGQPQGRQSQASGRAGQDGQGRQGGQGSRANQSGSGQQQTPQGQNQQGQNQQGQNQQGRNRQGQRGQGQNRQRQSGHPQQRSQGQNQPPQGNQAPNQPAQSGQSGRQNYPSGQQPGQNPPPEEEKKVQDWSPPTDDEDDE